MRVKLIAFTSRGCRLALRIAAGLGEGCEVHSKTSGDATGTIPVAESLTAWTAAAMAAADALVFVGAVGVAVRAIAPSVKDKETDPAVVCIDDNGRFAVSLLSGHVGGANRLTARIAAIVGATPVITTATDVNGRFAVDAFAAENGMAYRDRRTAKAVSAGLLEGRTVRLSSAFPVRGSLPAGIVPGDAGDLGILVSSEDRPRLPFADTLQLIPRHHVVGIGCRRGTGREALETMLRETLDAAGIAIESVRALASIDVKADEPAILALAGDLGVPALFHSAEELEAVVGDFAESAFVRETVGTGCVCERAAVRAAADGELVVRKRAAGGITVAVAREGFALDLNGYGAACGTEHDAAGGRADDTTENITDGITGDVTDNMADDTTGGMTDDTMDDMTDKNTDDMTIGATEGTTGCKGAGR